MLGPAMNCKVAARRAPAEWPARGRQGGQLAVPTCRWSEHHREEDQPDEEDLAQASLLCDLAAELTGARRVSISTRRSGLVRALKDAAHAHGLTIRLVPQTTNAPARVCIEQPGQKPVGDSRAA